MNEETAELIRNLLKTSGESVITAISAVDEFKKIREKSADEQIIGSLIKLIDEYAKIDRDVPAFELATLLVICSLMDDETVQSALAAFREAIARGAAWTHVLRTTGKQTLH